ncbi:hypothetical protein ACP3T3_19800 [Chryseobacterium sp. CBSDS_008]
MPVKNGSWRLEAGSGKLEEDGCMSLDYSLLITHYPLPIKLSGLGWV